MNQRKVLALALGLVGIFLGLRALRIGDLGVIDSWIARQHASKSFDPRSWSSGDPVSRGQMLSDLAASHRFVGTQASAIRELLGPSQCYVSYDDEPCYELQYGGAKYRLEFSVNHSDQAGQILSVNVGN